MSYIKRDMGLYFNEWVKHSIIFTKYLIKNFGHEKAIEIRITIRGMA
jgi:hypothetical protein